MVTSGQSVQSAIARAIASSTNPAAPTSAACRRPALTAIPASMAGRANSGSASRATRLSSDIAVSPETAASVLKPAVPSISYWTAAPAAAPPGRLFEMAFPVSAAVATENQAVVRSASRSRPK